MEERHGVVSVSANDVRDRNAIVTLIARDIGFREFRHEGLRERDAVALMLTTEAQKPGTFTFRIERPAPVAAPVFEPMPVPTAAKPLTGEPIHDLDQQF